MLPATALLFSNFFIFGKCTEDITSNRECRINPLPKPQRNLQRKYFNEGSAHIFNEKLDLYDEFNYFEPLLKVFLSNKNVISLIKNWDHGYFGRILRKIREEFEGTEEIPSLEKYFYEIFAHEFFKKDNKIDPFHCKKPSVFFHLILKNLMFEETGLLNDELTSYNYFLTLEKVKKSKVYKMFGLRGIFETQSQFFPNFGPYLSLDLKRRENYVDESFRKVFFKNTEDIPKDFNFKDPAINLSNISLIPKVLILTCEDQKWFFCENGIESVDFFGREFLGITFILTGILLYDPYDKKYSSFTKGEDGWYLVYNNESHTYQDVLTLLKGNHTEIRLKIEALIYDKVNLYEGETLL